MLFQKPVRRHVMEIFVSFKLAILLRKRQMFKQLCVTQSGLQEAVRVVPSNKEMQSL